MTWTDLALVLAPGLFPVYDTLPPSTRLDEIEVKAERNPVESIISIESSSLNSVGNAGESIEGVIRSLAGVAGSDELSSQYSVRGGNFDENLLVINGFEIYRPQLARSGQQEGLSAVNPDMVRKLEFSAGGFNSSEGDKLSSVLRLTYGVPSNEEAAQRSRIGLYSGRLFMSYRESKLSKSENKIYTNGGIAIRYRSNSPFILGGDTKGDLNSISYDIQLIQNIRTKKWYHEFLSIAQSSDFTLQPRSRTTEFGTVTDVLRLNVYMKGRESYVYSNAFAGWRSTYRVNSKLKLHIESSIIQALESENVDVISAYLLGEVNNNLGSDDFGEISYQRGSGGHQRFARNHLFARESHLFAGGTYEELNSSISFGVGLRNQFGIDQLYEWVNIDSAGYSIPHNSTEVLLIENDTIMEFKESLELFQLTNTSGELKNFKTYGFYRHKIINDQQDPKWALDFGVRLLHDSRSNEIRISPRFHLKHWTLSGFIWDLKAGSYAQTASVRELRNWRYSTLELNSKMQHAWHGIIGGEKKFTSNGRPFFWRTELYYKFLDRAFPFEQDGMRIRYLGNGPGVARVIGIDNRIHSQWLPKTESWISLSLFRSQEKFDNSWVRRGSDYRYSFSLRVEDALKGFPDNKVYMQASITGGFPFGSPLAFSKPFKAPPYRRMDLGFQHNLNTKASISLEIFNLLEIRNTASYFWIMDISTAREYAVPNYLTNRLINFIFQYQL